MSVVLATGGYDHRIRFWEAPSGVCTRMIKYNESQINKLEITPDKQFIAAAGNPSIHLYEIESSGSSSSQPQINAQQPHDPQQQEAVLILEGHTANVTSIGFQKDGRYLYSGSEDGTIKIWDLRDASYNRSFNVGAPVNSVCLRCDRDEFISGDQNGTVKIWSLHGGSGTSSPNDGCIATIKPGVNTNSTNNNYSDDVDNFASTNSTSTSIAGGGGNMNNNLHTTDGTNTADDNGDGRDATVGNNNSDVINILDHGNNYDNIDNNTKEDKPNSSQNHEEGNAGKISQSNSNTNSMASRGTGLTSSTRNSTKSHHSVSNTAKRCHTSAIPIQAVDISIDTRTLVAVSNHGTVYAWDASMSGIGIAASAASSQDDSGDTNENGSNIIGNNNASPHGLRSPTNFDAHTTVPGTYCLHARIAPDCRHLVTTASDGTALLWDTTTWELTNTLQHKKWVWDAAFSADSNYLVTASSDNVARLWNLSTGDVVRQYHGHQSAVTAVALNDCSV